MALFTRVLLSCFVFVSFIAVGTLVSPTDALSFCVYNKSDIRVEVIQTYGGNTGKGFSKVLGPGDSACCNWQDKDCNKSGKKDGVVRFSVMVKRDYNSYDSICGNHPVKAGGWMKIYNKHCKSFE